MSWNELDETRLRSLIEVGSDVVSNLDIESLLGQIVRQAAEITGAKYAALGVLNAEQDGLDRFVTHGVDEATRKRIGEPPKGLGVLGVLIKHPVPIRLAKVSEHPDSFGFPPNHPPMDSFLGAPIIVRGEVFGNLYLAEKAEGEFDQADQEAVELLASWAAIAIANADSARGERLRAVIAAAERERHRWALELHDETLQGLGALRMMLSAVQRSADPETIRTTLGEALDQLSLEITGLRGLITELRPAALDSLGLEAALDSLARRAAGTGDFDLDLTLNIEGDAHQGNATEQEITAYRLVQEALSNAAKHSRAKRVMLEVRGDSSAISITVEDDGTGFDPASRTSGFGLSGMRERVVLVDGRLEIASRPGGGTRVEAWLPLGQPK